VKLRSLIRRLFSLPPYWRSIKACERSDYRRALSDYETYRGRVGEERPSDRAFHAKVLILNSEGGEAATKLRELIDHLETGADPSHNTLSAYVLAYSKMTLAGLMGDAKRDEFFRIAASHEPPTWLKKVLPIAR
jgi:hypothetical protein